MTEYKILFTGAMGAGKTTAIGAVSEVPPVVTDVANSDAASGKATTTVGLDFGQLTLSSGDRVRLFGTPGQARFDFLWGILSRNALGLIILCDNSRPDPIGDLRVYLEGFADKLRKLPCVIGVGRLQTNPKPDLESYLDELARHSLVLPVLDVDVRQRADVTQLIDSLLSQLEATQYGEEAL